MPPNFDSPHAGWPPATTYAAAWAATLARRPNRPCAHVSNEHKKTSEEVKDELSSLQRPSTGRTTALGRRVEKPHEARPAGPSGQRNGVADRKHANK